MGLIIFGDLEGILAGCLKVSKLLSSKLKNLVQILLSVCILLILFCHNLLLMGRLFIYEEVHKLQKRASELPEALLKFNLD